MRIGRLGLLSFAVVAVLYGSPAARALGEGWSLRNLLPTTKEEKPRTKFTHKKNTGSQTLNGKPVNGNVKKPGALASFSNGTKRLMSKTKSMFTPGKKKTTEVRKVTGRQTIHKRTDKTAATKKQSGFGSLFAPEEPEPPQSIKEWLALPRSDL